MIITLVMDQYGDTSNGTTTTAMRLADIMRKHGHTVRIVTSVENVREENVYVVPERNLPLLNSIVHSQGMKLAKPDKKILTDAITGADIVHFFLPFGLSKAGKSIADKLHIATTAAFHVQPENITYTIKMNKVELVNMLIYKIFEQYYNKFAHIHCPSQMLKDILDGYGYKAKKHVISNGVSDYFVKTDSVRPKELEGQYLILMSGRFSREKRQDLIIEAVAGSKYADDIRLIFCGKGPWKKSLIKKAEALGLKNKPIFKFCDWQELRDTINYCDLYVHASDVEIEAISCMEAFSCGLVPVISDSPMVATKQFALDEKNLFRKGNAEDLRNKIEYFIEHPDEKREYSERYVEYAKNFRVENCVLEMEKMFETAIAENRAKWGDKVGVETKRTRRVDKS